MDQSITRQQTAAPEYPGVADMLFDAVDALDLGLILLDPYLRFAMANSQAEAMLGDTIGTLQPGDEVEIGLQRLAASEAIRLPAGMSPEIWTELSIKNLHACENDVEIHLRDGRIFLCSTRRTGKGNFLVTVRSDSERRRTEQRAQEMLNDAIEALDDGITLYDSHLRFVLSNRKRNEMFFGEGMQQEIGQHFSVVARSLANSGEVDLPDGMTIDQWTNAVVRGVRNYVKDFELEMPDGRIILGSSHKTELDGYLLTYRDITQQRRAEEARREADLLLQKIVEACPTTFLVSRAEDGKIIYCPPASCERFGELDATLGFFLEPEDRTEYLQALLPTGVVDDYPVQFRRKDGSIMQGLTSARVTDYKGENVIVSSTRDVSEQLAMQAELERQKDVAFQNEKLSALGELLASVAHELNNPLSIVVGYSLMLKDRVHDPALQIKVNRIGEAAERCSKIVKAFLAMARQRPIRLEKCALNDILHSALEVTGNGLNATGARIKLQFDPNLPPVAADPDQMVQVFTNLIVNAEHALTECGESGRLKLMTSFDKRRGEVVVRIRDNGPGVPKDIQARVFEPFYTTKDVGHGTGIGLAFSHRIITSHGGSLRLHSVPGKGATFIIRMPAAEMSDAVDAIEPKRLDVSNNHTVLVVDDEVGITELIRDILEESGYAVEVENEPKAALALLDHREFDVVLSDMKMPGLDGRAVLEQISKTSPGHAGRVAFITGDAMSTHVAKFLETTAALHLEKPVSPAELLDLVGRICMQNRDIQT